MTTQADISVERCIQHNELDCNKHVNGVCQLRSCLVAGGWRLGDKVDYSIATCPTNATIAHLRRLQEMESIRGNKEVIIEQLQAELEKCRRDAEWVKVSDIYPSYDVRVEAECSDGSIRILARQGRWDGDRWYEVKHGTMVGAWSMAHPTVLRWRYINHKNAAISAGEGKDENI